MSFKIKTSTLQELVGRSVKGVGNNKLIPLTSLMSMSLEKGILTFITTDSVNYLYIRQKADGEDFSVTVSADMFYKLISKLTCENVEIDLRDHCLELKGNGKYIIELPVDEDGRFISYPDPLKTFKAEGPGVEINLTTIDLIRSSIKPSLAVTLEVPCYTGYYVGDTVIGTDTFTVASMKKKLFDTPQLISSEMIDLCGVMTEEKIHVDIVDNVVVLNSPDCSIYGTTMEGIEEYAVTEINELLETEFSSYCKVSKAELLALLDRLVLFVGSHDKNEIGLVFTKDSIEVSSKALTGVEDIRYVESENFTEFSCKLDIQTFVQAVKSIPSSVVSLYYGAENAIKFVDGDISILLATLDDVDLEYE